MWSAREKSFIKETYSRIRLFEGVCEALPQLVLLMAYFTVSVKDPDTLAVSDDVDSYKGQVFFMMNILYSVFTLLFSLVNAVNTEKGGQLDLAQKACLFLGYLLQLLLRLGTTSI